MGFFWLNKKGCYWVTTFLMILIGIPVLRRFYKAMDELLPEVICARNQVDSLQTTLCDTILKVNAETMPKDYLDLKASLDIEINKYDGISVGNVAMIPKKEVSLLSAVRARSFRTICETGFNGGHSSLIWLYADKNTKVYSFDLGRFKYSKPAAAFLQHTFRGRLNVYWGNSKKTVPTFMEKEPQLKCDLIFIDGGHRYHEALHDLKNFHTFAKYNFSLLITDDSLFPAVSRAWKKQIQDGNVIEFCTLKGFIKLPNGFGDHNYSMSFGQYVGEL